MTYVYSEYLGFYDSGKDLSSENANVLSAIGERTKKNNFTESASKPVASNSFDSFKSSQVIFLTSFIHTNVHFALCALFCYCEIFSGTSITSNC